MNELNRLLVVIDPTEDNQKALDRALELSQKAPSQITLFLSIYDFSYEMTTMLSGDERNAMKQAVIADRSAWLEDMIRHHADKKQDLDFKVVWHNRPYESIIKEVLENDYDLVIKATHQHDSLKSVIFTPTDWHLLRKCPCPILLVKEHEWPEHGQVLAAVSTGTDDEEHKLLNSEIVNTASFMADLLRSTVHLVNAYPPTPVNIAVEIPEFDPNEYNASMCAHHEKSMAELANVGGIGQHNCHVLEGLPEDVIPRLAKDLDAELIVIGTVGRQGLSAALIGNTAEHVIDSVDCDLLAVKPLNFECPIKI